MRTATLALLTLLAFPCFATAQVERYELGRRMKAFEAQWEATTDAARKKKALAIVSDATTQFLTLRLGEAARTLDEARFALLSDEPPSDEERWLHSICAVPENRVIDGGKKNILVRVQRLYSLKGLPPEKARVTLRFGPGEGIAVSLAKLPVDVRVPLPQLEDGDWGLRLEVSLEGKEGISHAVGVSVVKDVFLVLDRRREIDRLLRAHDFSKHPLGIELATASARTQSGLRMAMGSHTADQWYPESDVSFAKQLQERDWMLFAALLGEKYFANRPGDHSITVPTAKDKSTPCRVFVPKGLDPKKPVPIVVALHGMGGSENLFFEGYGAGCVVKACEKRGWICVSPRGRLGFLSGPPPVTDILAKLGERYPIDPKRVFVVGHSMGAAQAIELAQEHSGKFAAVAALGGGGKVRKPEAFAQLPVFIGVGEKDFANRGAKATRDAIAKGSGEKLTFKEYPDVEHMVIVRVAVDDVFAVFDQAAK